MSVTFSAVDTPYEDIVEDGETYSVPKDGYTIINLSNVNARAFLEAIGVLSEDLFGKFDVDDVRYLKDRIEDLQNSNNLYKETTVEGRFVFIGRSVEYVNGRLTQFHNLATEAITRGVEITYA